MSNDASNDASAASHLSPDVIEQIAIGAPVDDAAVAHVSSCDACAEALAKEARLELALGELHAFVAGTRHVPPPSRLRVFAGPAVVLALAAALFLYLRDRGPVPSHEVRADPSVILATPGAAPASSDAASADVEKVIAKLRPQIKKCFRDSMTADHADGSVVLVIAIATDGSVTNVEATKRVGVSDASVACFVAVLQGARFEPSDKPRTVNVPVSFVVNH